MPDTKAAIAAFHAQLDEFKLTLVKDYMAEWDDMDEPIDIADVLDLSIQDCEEFFEGKGAQVHKQLQLLIAARKNGSAAPKPKAAAPAPTPAPVVAKPSLPASRPAQPVLPSGFDADFINQLKQNGLGELADIMIEAEMDLSLNDIADLSQDDCEEWFDSKTKGAEIFRGIQQFKKKLSGSVAAPAPAPPASKPMTTLSKAAPSFISSSFAPAPARPKAVVASPPRVALAAAAVSQVNLAGPVNAAFLQLLAQNNLSEVMAPFADDPEDEVMVQDILDFTLEDCQEFYNSKGTHIFNNLQILKQKLLASPKSKPTISNTVPSHSPAIIQQQTPIPQPSQPPVKSSSGFSGISDSFIRGMQQHGLQMLLDLFGEELTSMTESDITSLSLDDCEVLLDANGAAIHAKLTRFISKQPPLTHTQTTNQPQPPPLGSHHNLDRARSAINSSLQIRTQARNPTKPVSQSVPQAQPASAPRRNGKESKSPYFRGVVQVGQQYCNKYEIGGDFDAPYGQSYNFVIQQSDTSVIQDKLSGGTMWEFHVMLAAYQFIKPNSIVLDVGGNIGMSAIPFSRMGNKKAFIHTFEPQQRTFHILRENARQNNARNVIAHNFAVGHEHTQLQLGKPPANKTGVTTGGVQIGQGGETVEMVTLDAFSFSNVSLMKVDVEGAERLVFWGAREMLRRNKPSIIVELTGDPLFSDRVESHCNLTNEQKQFSILGFLKSIGYNRIVLLPPLYENVLVLHSSTSPAVEDPAFQTRPIDLTAMLKRGARDPRTRNASRFTDMIKYNYKCVEIVKLNFAIPINLAKFGYKPGIQLQEKEARAKAKASLGHNRGSKQNASSSYCPSCGKIWIAGAMFCTQCGAKRNAAPAAAKQSSRKSTGGW